MSYKLIFSDGLCYKYAEDIFEMRNDKKKDFYYLLNDKKEDSFIEKNDKVDRNESKSTRKGSSFIFGMHSKKSEKAFKTSDCENSFQQNSGQEDIPEPEVKIIIDANKMGSNNTLNSTNDDIKINQTKPLEDDKVKEKTILKEKSIKEEKVVKSLPIKPKVEEEQIISIDIPKSQEQKVPEKKEAVSKDNEIIQKSFEPNKMSDNSDKTFKSPEKKLRDNFNQNKVKNSILTHWETRTLSFEKPSVFDENIKNISIQKDELHPSTVINRLYLSFKLMISFSIWFLLRKMDSLCRSSKNSRNSFFYSKS